MNNNNVSQAEFMLFIPSCTLDMNNNVIQAQLTLFIPLCTLHVKNNSQSNKTFVVHSVVHFTCEK